MLSAENFTQSAKQVFFFFFCGAGVGGLQPFQECFTYIKPIPRQRWAKTGEPGEKTPDRL